MGAVEATVKIVTGLAWPLVVLVSVILLRRHVGDLMPRLSRLKAPGIEAEFAREAAEANDLAEVVLPAPELPNVDESEDDDPSSSFYQLLMLADLAPHAAITIAWDMVDNAMSKIDARLPGMSHSQLRQALRKDGLLGEGVIQVIQRLRRLRGLVVHGSTTPDPIAARDFVEAAWRLRKAIDATHGMAALVEPRQPAD